MHRALARLRPSFATARRATPIRPQHRNVSSRNYGDVAGVARLLHAFEVDDRFAIREYGLQLVVLRRCQIALREYDLIVGRHPDAELAVLGIELLLRELARRLRRLHA